MNKPSMEDAERAHGSACWDAAGMEDETEAAAQDRDEPEESEPDDYAADRAQERWAAWRFGGDE